MFIYIYISIYRRFLNCHCVILQKTYLNTPSMILFCQSHIQVFIPPSNCHPIQQHTKPFFYSHYHDVFDTDTHIDIPCSSLS